MLSFVIGHQNTMPDKRPDERDASEVEARRAFLKNCAKYAAAMPPAIAILVSAKNALASHNPGHTQSCNVTCQNPSEDPLFPECICDSGIVTQPEDESSPIQDPEPTPN